MTETPKINILNSESVNQNLSAPKDILITDDSGRKISLKKPNVLAQYRIVEMLGDTSKNQVYMGMTMPLLYIDTIDGMGVPLSTKNELEALILRLGDDGISKVMLAVEENFMPKKGDEKEAIKK